MQLLFFKVEVAAVSLRLCQCTVQRPFYPHGVMRAVVRLPHDGIHPPEAEPRHPAELKGTLPQDVQAGRTKVVVNLLRCFGGQLKGSQKRQDIAEHPALPIRVPDVLKLVLRDAPDLQQPLRAILQDVQGAHAEPSHNLGGGLLPDALYQPGTQVGQHPLLCLLHDLMALLHLELHAVFPVHPFPLQLQFHRIRHGDAVAHGREMDQVVPVPPFVPGLCRDGGVGCLYRHDAVLVRRVGEYGTFILHCVAHFYLLVSLVQQVLLIIIMIVPAMAAPVSREDSMLHPHPAFPASFSADGTMEQESAFQRLPPYSCSFHAASPPASTASLAFT